jgi:hypothetical protein
MFKWVAIECGCESEADHGGVVQQVTGGDDLIMLNIPTGDEGGELDPQGMSPVSRTRSSHVYHPDLSTIL